MDWTKGWRDTVWSDLGQAWDLIIIGGGITGAGILREASHARLRTLLVEANDFASGTSSRSSKLVHGGLRYLKNAEIKLTLQSVREREYLLRQGRGLVNKLGFLYPCLQGDRMPGWVFGAGLAVYDLMAGQWSHRSYDREDMRELCAPLTTQALRGGYRYFDANTDDARLVLRLLRESVADGVTALNYAKAESLLRSRTGQVCGVLLRDTSGEQQREAEVHAKVVINATGAWADSLRTQLQQRARLRPLRGSHFVLPLERLPLTRAVSFLHPRDGRPVFALPWEGAVIFGTTDVDHGAELEVDPSLSSMEADYLMDALQFVFPEQGLGFKDVMATFSGLRPVINTGKADPSQESREHAIWKERGLLTISGGKLTTFRVMARQALHAVRQELGGYAYDQNSPLLGSFDVEAEQLMANAGIPARRQLRLLARYGSRSAAFFQAASAQDRESIGPTLYSYSELRQAACSEAVVHLDDLLLRRVRLGLLAPQGGMPFMSRIRSIVQAELAWNDERWEAELASYAGLWRRAYSLNI